MESVTQQVADMPRMPNGESCSISNVFRLVPAFGQLEIVPSIFHMHPHPQNRDRPAVAISPFIDRQALHAAELAFAHPMTAEWHSFTAPLPEDMELAIELVRGL